MNSAPYSVMALDAVHERESFNSESEPLNRYFQQQVTQDIRRRVAWCACQYSGVWIPSQYLLDGLYDRDGLPGTRSIA